MPLSTYDAAVPPAQRALNNLSAILRKAEQFAEARKIDPSVLLQARLAPDMFPLVRQVQVVCDSAKSGAGRLAGVEIPSDPDTEVSFAELQARIAKTAEFLSTLNAGQFEGAEDRIITLPVPGSEMKLPGRFFLFGFVLPNLYFHMTTAYAILRHNGVELGKMDYLGGA